MLKAWNVSPVSGASWMTQIHEEKKAWWLYSGWKRASILNWNKGKPENQFGKENFEYEAVEDCFICPNGQKLTFHFEYVEITKNKTVRIHKGTHCKQCLDTKKCAKNFRDGKVIKNFEGMEVERRELADKMLSSEGVLIYQIRKKIVECIFGHLKRNLGFIEFLLRGLRERRSSSIWHVLARTWDEYGTFWTGLVQ